MASNFDLVIRGGLVADGLGSPLIEADVGVRGDRIGAVGIIPEHGSREIDAKGLLVTPGFVDIHTHYDGQVTWDRHIVPSSWNGITTVVMGNCGVGFAPVRNGDQEALIELMEGIEDIPGTALHEGLKWNWESFADYLDVLDTCSWDVDVCAQLPHAPLRVYVMGERALQLEDATPEDISRMQAITRDAMRAGAIGFSTSRFYSHKSIRGVNTPSYRARQEELRGIAAGLREAGSGVLQLISDFLPEEREAEYKIIEEMLRASGRPMSITLLEDHQEPDAWRQHWAMIERCRADGLALSAQVAPRPAGIIFGLKASWHPFKHLRCFRAIADLPLSEQVAIMHTAEFRAKMHSNLETAKPYQSVPSRLFQMGSTPDYGLDPSKSMTAIAEREGRNVNDVILDALIADEGNELLFYAALNYFHHDFRVMREMLAHPAALIALGDGGAHVGQVQDASFQTSSLMIWGEELGIPAVVRLQTSAPAHAVGLYDRGVIAPGMKADINVIDLENLRLDRPHQVSDLPSGASRLVQKAHGYVATIVAGQQTYANGEATGALPGRLVRGPQKEPAADETRSASIA